MKIVNICNTGLHQFIQTVSISDVFFEPRNVQTLWTFFANNSTIPFKTILYLYAFAQNVWCSFKLAFSLKETVWFMERSPNWKKHYSWKLQHAKNVGVLSTWYRIPAMNHCLHICSTFLQKCSFVWKKQYLCATWCLHWNKYMFLFKQAPVVSSMCMYSFAKTKCMVN